jgi:hypothetical protein
MDGARPELLPSVPGAFDTATAGGDDERSGPRAAAAPCMVRWDRRAQANDGPLLRGRCSRNGYGAKDAACRATKSRALVAGLPRIR